MARIAPLALAALLSMVVFSFVQASGEDIPIETVNNESRQLYLDKDTFFASISSYSEAEGSPWFKFSMDAHDELGIKATYGFNDRARAYVGMDLKFIALIEYFDSNWNGVYDEKDERMASFYPLSISAYDTDFINKEREWNETKVDSETEIIQNGTWDLDYSEAYQTGFLKGWKLGVDAGTLDHSSTLPFQPDPSQRIPHEMEEIKASFDVDLSSKNAYPPEVHAWLLEGALNAFYAGFEHGYTQEYYLKRTANSADEAAPKDETTRPTTDDASSATTDKPTSSDTNSSTSSSTGVSVNESAEKDSATSPTAASDTTTSVPEEGTTTSHTTDPMADPSSSSKADRTSASTAGTRGGDPTLEPVTLVRPAQNIVPKYRPLMITQMGQDGSDRIVIETWDNNGYFGIRCVVSNEFSIVDNGYLSPASIKIDMMIGKYPFRSNVTKLALLMEMGSDIQYSGKVDMVGKEESYDQAIGLASGEEEISFDASEFSGFLSWIKTAKVDGEDTPVRSRVLNSVYGKYWEDQGGTSENHRGVLFCYPRAKQIVHDNKLGFVEIEEINVYTGNFPINPEQIGARTIIGDPILYIAGIFAVAILVASTWKRRGPPK